MLFAIPLMLLVPAGVVAILVTFLEGFLYPSKFWKFLWAFTGGLFVASQVMPKIGIDEKYTLGVTLVIMTMLLLTQSWRWLTPFWIFFLVSLFALMLLYAVVGAALGLEIDRKTYNPGGSPATSTQETVFMWTMVGVSAIGAVVGTILLNTRGAYSRRGREEVRRALELPPAASTDLISDGDDDLEYLPDDVPHELKHLAATIMWRYFQWIHYPSSDADSPELERARTEVPNEVRALVERRELKSGDVIFLGFLLPDDPGGHFSRFLFRVRLDGVLIELSPQCRLAQRPDGEWGYTFAELPEGLRLHSSSD